MTGRIASPARELPGRARALASGAATTQPRRGRHSLWLACGVAALTVLAGVSVFVGVADLSPADLLTGRADPVVLFDSRVPRTLALLLAGSALAVSGLIMQLLTRNIFVEPSTAGTLDFATLGLLGAALLWPDAPVMARMLLATLAALAGTGIFMRILRALPLHEPVVVPLVGLMLGAVVGAFCTFIAYRNDLLQSLGAWTNGDFSAVLAGRYELLWVAGGLVAIAGLVADRFTVAGMGEAFTTNLGLDYRRTLAVGLTVVAITSATVVISVGALPFLGLIVPNLVRSIIGDNARRSVPWVAVIGAGLVLCCDLVARVVIFPFELPIGTVMGVLGSVAFLALLLGRRRGRV